MRSSASVGAKEQYLKTWETPRYSLCTRIKEKEANAITTEEYHFSALFSKSSQESRFYNYRGLQCAFRAGRSTIDMIFSLRQLQGKCREQGMPLYLAFIDLTKAFETVSRDGLFKALSRLGCPPKLQSIIESFHTGMTGTVQFKATLPKSSKSEME